MRPDRHKANPVTFRPPEDDREWLYAHAEATGQSVGAVLSGALAAYRRVTERPLPAAVVTGKVVPAPVRGKVVR